MFPVDELLGRQPALIRPATHLAAAAAVIANSRAANLQRCPSPLLWFSLIFQYLDRLMDQLGPYQFFGLDRAPCRRR